MARWLAVLGVALVALGLAISGCTSGLTGTRGDTGAGAAEGSFAFTATWPAAEARLIPAASASIKVVVSDRATGAELGTLLLTRDTPHGTTGKLPADTACRIRATAHPNANGTGTAQAAATIEDTVPHGDTKSIVITLASTIATVGISPSPATVGVGGTVPVTATAYNSNSAVVLVPASGWTWSTGNTAVATVSQSGVVSGVAAGSTSVTALENESGVSGATTVTVTALPALSVSPMSLDFGSAQTSLPLSVQNVGDGTLSWSCSDDVAWATVVPASGTNNGSVSVNVSRAGLTPGSYSGHARFTSNGGNATVALSMTVPPPRFFDDFPSWSAAWTPVAVLAWPAGSVTTNQAAFTAAQSWAWGIGFPAGGGRSYAQYWQGLPFSANPAAGVVLNARLSALVNWTAPGRASSRVVESVHNSIYVVLLTASNEIAGWIGWGEDGAAQYDLSVVTSDATDPPTVETLYTWSNSTGADTKLGLRRVGGTWHAYREDAEVGTPAASTFTGTISRVAVVASWEPGLPTSTVEVDYVEVTQP